MRETRLGGVDTAGGRFLEQTRGRGSCRRGGRARRYQKPLVLDVVLVHFPRESFSKIYLPDSFSCWIAIFLWHMERGETSLSETMVIRDVPLSVILC